MSKREQVIEAIVALVDAALPAAKVERNAAKPERIPPGGLVIVRDSDPGEPEVILSPLTYIDQCSKELLLCQPASVRAKCGMWVAVVGFVMAFSPLRNHHPEPGGSRRATPPSLIQHRPGQSRNLCVTF